MAWFPVAQATVRVMAAMRQPPSPRRRPKSVEDYRVARSQADERVAAWALAAPAAWVASTLVRGELIGFYPYPFVDVDEYGYGRVALNIGLIAVLFYALARGAVWLDRRLASRHSR